MRLVSLDVSPIKVVVRGAVEYSKVTISSPTPRSLASAAPLACQRTSALVVAGRKLPGFSIDQRYLRLCDAVLLTHQAGAEISVVLADRLRLAFRDSSRKTLHTALVGLLVHPSPVQCRYLQQV